MSIRVDGELKEQIGFPVVNGAVDNDQSLTTGPGAQELDNLDDVPGLGWARLVIELNEASNLLITYKGREVFNGPVEYFASPGQLVFAGRTGGSNAFHHIDNIRVVTTAATTAVVSALSGNGCGFTVEVADTDDSIFDITKPITVTLNDQEVEVSASKEVNTTTLVYSTVLPALLPVGDHVVSVKGEDTVGNPIESSKTFTITPYATVDPAWAATGVDTSTRGFVARVHQIGFGRAPGDANSIANGERQLAGFFRDPATGMPVENLIDTTDMNEDGTFLIDGALNLDQDGGVQGTFDGEDTIPGIPGTTDSTDNIAAEFTAYLDMPAGCFELIVNSDDGFVTSFGSEPRDVFSRSDAGFFNGGRGASDTQFSIAVPVAGIYPVRIAWWEGGGGANIEFVMINSATGEKILVNDDSVAESFAAYPTGTAASAYVRAIEPRIDSTDADPARGIEVQFVDGATALVDASVEISLDGTPLTVTTTEGAGGVTTALGAYPSPLAPGSAHTVELKFDDGSGTVRTETWSFTAPNYASLDGSLALNVNSGVTPGFIVNIYQPDPSTFGENGSTTAGDNVAEVADGFLAGLGGENAADFDAVFEPFSRDGDSFVTDGVINLDQDAGDVGGFPMSDPIPGIPGTTGSTDGIAGEFLTWISFPEAGYYQLGVNSDDNFRVTASHEPAVPPLVINGDPILAVPSVRGEAGIFAPLPVPAITQDLVLADPELANAPLTNAADVAGKIVVIRRGENPFAEKLANAQAAGAVGAIVVTNNDDYPIVMGGDDAGVTIPGLMSGLSDGAALISAMDVGTVSATISGETKAILGQFQGGRGAADTIFGFYVPRAGLYPLRTVWKEGGGGANIEIFSLPYGGFKILVNDEDTPGALQAFREVTGGAGGLAVTSINYDPAGKFTFTWNSKEGRSYRIEKGSTLVVGEFDELEDGYGSQGESTSYTDESATEEEVYYRVVEE
jgi:hypothetical protein